MSSPSSSPTRVTPSMPEISTCIQPSFEKLISESNLVAGILSYRPSEQRHYAAACSVNIPLAPFNGVASGSLTALLIDCHMRHPRPHVHSLKSSEFWKNLSSVCDTRNWRTRGLFIPFLVGDDSWNFLLFSTTEEAMNADPSVVAAAEALTAHAAAIMRADQLAKDLRVTEHYVKELGHDLASSVQAIISKIRNVRMGYVQGVLADTKLQEVETEIMSIYRNSDTMGITVDPLYNIRDGSDFNILDSIKAVITLCESEAAERHITFEEQDDELSNPILWGDRKAIESALTQFVINAIKYSRGSSKIFIRAKTEIRDRIRVSVTNFGISIAEDFRGRMWDFGERGREALELHANGSGIGLFTVRKIVRAHGGTVEHAASGTNSGCNTFSFVVPRRDLLQKESCFR